MSDIDTGGPVVQLPLLNGGVALVSSDSETLVIGIRWRLGANGYVYRVGGRLKGVPCLLHRIVMAAERGIDIHHINGIKTDCRTTNLRALSPSEHQDHHKHTVQLRNAASRIYEAHGKCLSCSSVYEKHPDHRGRQIYCSQACAKADLKKARERNRVSSKLKAAAIETRTVA